MRVLAAASMIVLATFGAGLAPVAAGLPDPTTCADDPAACLDSINPLRFTRHLSEAYPVVQEVCFGTQPTCDRLEAKVAAEADIVYLGVPSPTTGDIIVAQCQLSVDVTSSSLGTTNRQFYSGVYWQGSGWSSLGDAYWQAAQGIQRFEASSTGHLDLTMGRDESVSITAQARTDSDGTSAGLPIVGPRASHTFSYECPAIVRAA